MYFTKVDVKLQSKYVAFYFCLEIFSGLGFLNFVDGVSASNTTVQ